MKEDKGGCKVFKKVNPFIASALVFLLMVVLLTVFPEGIANAAGSFVITSVAGNGQQGYSGDKGSATQAKLNQPSGVAVDSYGNLYIADTGNNVIRKVDAKTGIISSMIGGLKQPSGVAVDSIDNLYIVDTGAKVIRKVDAKTGFISRVAGGGNGFGVLATQAKLTDPTGLALDRSGNLYIVERGYNVILKVDAKTGIISAVAGNREPGYSGDGKWATNAQLYNPNGIAVDSYGNLFIADYVNDVIRKVDTSGKIWTVVGNGHFGYSGDYGFAYQALLNGPSGVAIDSNNNLYITDLANNVIRYANAYSHDIYKPSKTVDGNSTIYTIAGNGQQGYSGNGGLATQAKLNQPLGIAVDSSGNLYIADQGNNMIRKVVYVPPSSDANLSSLALSNGKLSPSFATDTTNYTATVNVSSITVTPTERNSKAQVWVNGYWVLSGTPTNPINLNIGSNTIKVGLTAEDGKTNKDYTVKVTRLK
jgi:trimeric autotransporter adhesin